MSSSAVPLERGRGGPAGAQGDAGAEAEKAGSSWLNIRGYVFCREDGQQLDRYELRWRVKKAYRAAGLKITDPYSMRHTFASLMDYAGETHQTIADMMGHRNVTTFEVVYRHNLRPVVKGGHPVVAPVGSTAVREFIENDSGTPVASSLGVTLPNMGGELSEQVNAFLKRE